MLKNLWNDESGSVGLEYLVITTLIGLALIVGANTVGVALNAEYTELAGGIVNISQEYTYSGFSTCDAQIAGGATTDADGTNAGLVTDGNVSVITVSNCNP